MQCCSVRFYSLFLLIILLSTLSSCYEKKAPPQPPPVRVAVETIEAKNYPALFEYVGVVQSSHEVEIRARVTGYLDTIGYLEGSVVQKGDLLFQLDPRPYQAALAKANAQLASEQSVLWQAQRSVKRFTPLYEKKAASQRDLDNAIASEMSAEAQVMAAQAQVADAEINLSYTTIRSPVSGTASQAKFRVGSLITEGQDSMTTLYVVDPIWVLFSVSEQDLLQAMDEVKAGRMIFPKNNEFDIELILADKSVYPQKGTVNFTSPFYSGKTGTLTVRAVLPNTEDVLKPGQFVRVRIYGAIRPNAIAIPQSAVQQGKNGPFVFVVNANHQAEVRMIKLGPWDRSNWIIWEGLKPGDQVILSGVNKLLPGTPITVIKQITISEEETPKGEGQEKGKTGQPL